ncbi:unnamed protein product [Rhizoctonia solani]|uniref:Uncharacterized protein n=1 Tax=Rhizoctonia solani TaxID=456999 RepID=A0A8H3HEY5_9AGAM|nr:unnamed protein product [Rhizoctonia solani]
MFSPDGTQIAVHYNNKVYLLSSSTGRTILPPFEAHQNFVSLINFSPDGSRIVSSDSETAYVWSTQSGKVILGPLEAVASFIIEIAFSPDSGSVVSLLRLPLSYILDSPNSPQNAQQNGKMSQYAIRIWNTLGGIQTIHPQISEDIDITATSIGCLSGKQCVIFAYHGGILICNLEGVCAREIAITDNALGFVTQVRMSPHGTHVAALLSGHIFVWDLNPWDEVLRPLEISSEASEVSFSPYDFYLASISFQEVRIWDVRNGSLVSGPFKQPEDPMSPCFSPDGTSVICGSRSGKLYLWDVRSPCILRDPLQGHAHAIASISFHPDGTRLVSGSKDGTACVWDAVSGEMVLGPLRLNLFDAFTAFSPDGDRLILTQESGFALVLLDAQTGSKVAGPFEFALWGNTRGVAFSPNGSSIAIANGTEFFDYEHGYEDHVRVIAVDTGNTLWSTRLHHEVYSAPPTFSPDGMRLIIRSCHYLSKWDFDADKLYVYDAHSGDLLSDKVHGNYYRSKVLPDGTGIIASFQSQIIVQDINTGQKELRSLGWDTNEAELAEFSRDCTHIAFATKDRAIYVYNTHIGQRILDLVNWHTSSISRINFSLDGTQLVTGSYDHIIKVTDIRATPPYFLGSSTKGFGEWRVRDDGWVVDKSSKLLVWIPPNLRSLLVHPRTKLLISRRGYLRLNFEGTYIGELWAKCYKEL